jgi:hypothetical protein
MLFFLFEESILAKELEHWNQKSLVLIYLLIIVGYYA